MTIEDAKKDLRANWHKPKGVECPCCGQLVKLYKRKLNSGMAVTLIRIYQHHGINNVNVKEFLLKNGFKNNHDWTLLRHWKMIQEVPDDKDPEKKSSGVWHITETGLKFLSNEYTAPTHILIYNNKLQGFSSETLRIEDSLGYKFNYKELMNENIERSY